MNKYLYLLLITILSIIAVSCGSTNNLANFDMKGKTIYYEEKISGDAQKVNITYTQESSNNDEKKKKTSDAEKIGSALATISASILTSDIESKVQRASDPNMVVQTVSTEVENTLKKYYAVKAAPTTDDNFDYIATITLENLTLNSSPNGLTLMVKANTLITSRSNGAVVWENSESETVPLRQSSTNTNNGKKSALETGLANVIQAAELSALSEERIKNAFERASAEVGRLMGETLRQDIAEAAKKGSN